jgi:hypothetical protein
MTARPSPYGWRRSRALRSRCRHRVLAFVGRNDGVICQTCGSTWRRRVRYLGVSRISRLVRRPR